jgi:hypothetical protein
VVTESKQETNPMPLKLDAVPVPASFRKRHERKGGAELDMYSVAQRDGFLRLTVGVEQAGKKGARVTHISVSFALSCDPDAPPTRRPSDKELREVRAHFSYIGTLEEDNSESDAGGLVRHLWGEGK